MVATKTNRRALSQFWLGAPLFLATFTLALFGVHGQPSAAADADDPAVVVTMTDQLKFNPGTVTVQVGDTVEWKNTSLLAHTVTADPALAARQENVALPEGAQPFHSGIMKPNDTFRHKFATPGKYRYFCIPHEATGMVAEVVVQGK